MDVVTAAVTIGVDIGQRVDPTAIAVAELQERSYRPGYIEVNHVIRYLERLPLGTPYPAVALRLAQVAARAGRHGRCWPRLYLDATGVGQPVVDLLRDHGVAADLVPTYFTHGDRRSVEAHHRSVLLGKAWLVSRLQALLQTGRLHLPRTDEAKVLQQELIDYEIKVDQDANDKYGAFKVGTHDDLVTALGLATQEDPDPVARAFAAAAVPEGRGRAWDDPESQAPWNRPPSPAAGTRAGIWGGIHGDG